MKSTEQTLASIPAGAFWAKRSPSGWHPLDAHLLDVGAVVHTLLMPGTPLARRLAVLAGSDARAEELRRLAIYAGLLHDIGKAQHGFQARLEGWMDFPRSSHVQRFITELRSARNMGVASRSLMAIREAALKPIKQSEGLSATAHDWLASVIAHHGRPCAAVQLSLHPSWHADWLPSDGRDPAGEALRLIEQAARLAGVTAPVPAPDTAASHLLAGVLTLADWLGSSTELFPLTSRVLQDADAYWTEAQSRAAHGLRLTGTRRAVSASVPTSWQGLFPDIADRPTELQRRLCDSTLPSAGALLIVESDTGSGKTEAALALFARLRAAGQVDGLFFALPTRATASAMRDRIERFARRTMPEAAGNIVLAAGGMRSSPADAQDEPEDPDEPAAAVRWASQSLTKALAGELVVGTIDQALLAVLPAKHAHLRLAALDRLLFVVDELHSYDAYMLTLLAELVAYLRASGAIVVAMSATLAASAVARLSRRRTEVDVDSAATLPFPSLTVAPPEGAPSVYPVASPPDRARTYWTTRSNEGLALADAVRRAEEGARVLILRNTVAKAIETMTHLSATHRSLLFGPEGHPATPYHSRYTPADRTTLDVAVRQAFGPGSRTSASILVATQVAEQSLDVDFDFLVTDLCPIDVLLQRLGRVHRHSRTRPSGCEQPSARIILPAADLATGTVRGGDRALRTAGLGSVYEDLATLELTLRLLERQPELSIPDRSRFLIEEVYHPVRRDELAESDDGWASYLLEQEGKDSGRRSLAMRLRIPLLTRSYASNDVCELFRMAADSELEARTRLGDDRVLLPLPLPVPHHFASEPADHTVMIEWRKLRLKPRQPVPEAQLIQPDAPYTVRVGEVELRYTPVGWMSSTAT